MLRREDWNRDTRIYNNIQAKLNREAVHKLSNLYPKPTDVVTSINEIITISLRFCRAAKKWDEKHEDKKKGALLTDLTWVLNRMRKLDEVHLQPMNQLSEMQ